MKNAEIVPQRNTEKKCKSIIAGFRVEDKQESMSLYDLPKGARFHEAIASSWAIGYARGSFNARLNAFGKILDTAVSDGKHWLDLGCGAGVLAKELALRGANITAIDGSPKMIDAAKGYVGMDYAERIRWILGDVARLECINDESFDGILCSSVIEYVDSPDVLLSEAFRVLAPHGQLLISVPTKWSLIRTVQKVLRYLFSIFGKDKFSYLSVSRFEVYPQKVAFWLGKSGFSVERVTFFDPYLKGVFRFLFRPSLLIVEARKTP